MLPSVQTCQGKLDWFLLVGLTGSAENCSMRVAIALLERSSTGGEPSPGGHYTENPDVNALLYLAQVSGRRRFPFNLSPGLPGRQDRIVLRTDKAQPNTFQKGFQGIIGIIF